MSHPNQVQYPVPRCPRCRQHQNSANPRLRRLGFSLREVRRTTTTVLVRCQFCHYEWWSKNDQVRAGCLITTETTP